MKKYYNLLAIIMISGLLRGEAFTPDEQSALNKLYANGVNLKTAIERGDINAATLLIKAGADVNHGCPIVIACSNGNIEMVKFLAEQHADLNCVPAYGEGVESTPLTEVARCGWCGINSRDLQRCKRCAEVAKVLLEHGAQVNKRSTGNVGPTPLDFALKASNKDVKDVLLQYGAKTSAELKKK
jgi:ankyrin repeat protein